MYYCCKIVLGIMIVDNEEVGFYDFFGLFIVCDVFFFVVFYE